MRRLECTLLPGLAHRHSQHAYSHSELHHHHHHHPPQKVDVDGLELSQGSLCLAWAHLLRELTGHNEVVFHCDSGLVRVDCARQRIDADPRQNCSTSSKNRHTGLFFRPVPRPFHLGLFLYANTATGLAFLYFPSYVSAATVRDLCHSFERIVRRTLPSAPNSPPATMALEASVERLSISNPNPLLCPGPQLLHHLLENSRGSKRPAVDFLRHDGSRESITYQELHDRSDAWASLLLRELAGQSQRADLTIPLLVRQSPELYIIQLAILKAGASFCPLNLDAPIERIRFILADVNAHVVITSSDLAGKIPKTEGLKLLRSDRDEPRSTDGIGRQPSIGPDRLAYVMYTSGSTGMPKGVAVSHLAASQSLLAHDRHVPRFDRFLQFAAPTFDVSVFEIFFTLYRGSTLVGCDRTTLLDDLPAAMNAMNVDAAELTPTVAGGLLRERSAVPGLRLLLTIGEMLTPHVVNEFGSTPESSSILWGMYGPTECAIHCTLQPAFPSDVSVGRIGFPLDTVSAFVVAPSSENSQDPIGGDVEVLPVGEAGELAIGGHQLASGYINRPEQTSAAFIQSARFGRLYRTGDKAKMLSDGTFECLGRISAGQVKLRGQRVELGEVEQVVTKLPSCRTAAAMVISGILVVFCLVPDGSLGAKEVLDLCRHWLPAFMVPGDVVILERFPQLPSGKIDRKSLERQYEEKRSSQSSQVSTPTTESTDILTDVFQKLLGRQIFPDAALATYGLDSLLAIRAASLLRQQGFHIGPVDILEAGSVHHIREYLNSPRHAEGERPGSNEAITRRLNAFREKAQGASSLAGLSHDISDILPATPLQESMLAEMAVDPKRYCNWVELDLPNGLESEKVTRCLFDLASNNEILRTGFCSIADSTGSYGQVIWKELLPAQIERVDNFQRSYTMDSAERLLRPLMFQIKTVGPRSYILMQIPHPLYDGWTIDLLCQDLTDLLANQKLLPRPQFRSVAQYYIGLQDSVQLKESRDYWSAQLADFQPRSLPNFNGRGNSNADVEIYSQPFAFSLAQVKKQAAELEINPQVFFQAALAYIIHSYLGTEDVAIGTVTSGRTIPVANVEDIFGPCIATLPLRLDLAQMSTARDLLLSIHWLNRQMIKHCTLPLREIKKICGLPPGLALFDVLFVWQESLSSSRDDQLCVRQTATTDKVENPLLLEVEPHDEEIIARVTYDSSIIPDSQVMILLSQLNQLTQALLNNATLSLQDFSQNFDQSILSIANLHPQLSTLKNSLSEAVERYAAYDPDRVAISFYSSKGRSDCTYAELNATANRLAHLLVARGVMPNDPVCICMEKSIALYVSILAVIKAGAGYVPLTPDTPPARVHTILADANVRVCLSDHQTFDMLSNDVPREVVNVLSVDLPQYSDDNLDTPFDGSNLAYAVFTSGSTGTPKGVLVTQANLISNLEVLSEMYPVFEESRLLQGCSQAFDVSVFEIFFAWYTGMCLCSAVKDDLFFDLEAMIRRMQITHLSFTPTVAALINPDNVPSVKFLVTAGEGVTEHVKRSWAGRGLWQGYGPSETTNICTVKPNVLPSDAINNIGPSFRNTSTFVFDRDRDSLTPRGGVGELCFGGDQVFRGYLNRPELTASKFIEHPVFGRLYRSGDMGQLLPDNSILFFARADDQVKIRGQRVELGEINSCVLENETVRDCISLVITPPSDAQRKPQRLVTFFVHASAAARDYAVLSPTPEVQDAITNIFQHLSTKLPIYMIPSALIPLSTLPRTTQWKVDKRRLTQSFYDIPTEQLSAFTAEGQLSTDSGEWTELERSIAHCLSPIVQIPSPDIGRHTSFFGLGLDSISAISLSRSLGDQGHAHITVSDILKNPTVAKLGAILSQRSHLQRTSADSDTSILSAFSQEVHDSIAVKFESNGRKVLKILPCTPLQEAMLSGSGTSEKAYLNRMVFRIVGDAKKMRECWNQMFCRHDILRTCFLPTEHPRFAFAQIVLEYTTPDWTTIITSEESLDHVLEGLSATIGLHTYDQGIPPLRVAFVKTEERQFLVFCCHHALYDGAAINNLLQEIEQLYNGSKLPPPAPYEPFLSYIAGLKFQDAEQFWSRTLRSFEPTSFPDLTSISSSVSSRSTAQKTFTKTLDLPLNQIQDVCRRLSISLLSAAQAAWAKLLAHYLGETDICFGNVVSGRTFPLEKLDQLVAPCFNTLPVRIKLSSGTPTADLMAGLQAANVDMLPYQMTPLRKIQAKFSEEGKRLFDTLFILQQPTRELDATIWSLVEDVGFMDFPLVCEVTPFPTEDALSVSLHYHSTIATEQEIAIVFETYDYALRSCLVHPASHSLEITALPPQMLSISTPEPKILQPSSGPLLHSGFEKNTQISPEAVAIDFLWGDGRREYWSFQTLNALANGIAHKLLEHGVGPEESVPIFMYKSPLFYACVLGVLKAGAAFTPVDPKLPETRRDYIVGELQARVVLSDGDLQGNWAETISVVNASTITSTVDKPPVTVTEHNLAYNLYTSGSTGKPKAVAVEHRNPVQTIESSRSLIPWNKDSRLLQYAATTFDMCYYDCFLAWTFGFCLCAAEQSVMFNDLVSVIRQMDITLLDLTPSVAISLSPSDVPSVDYLYCIGEAMPKSLAESWARKCVNSYGPTEAAFCCSIFPVDKHTKSTVIGRPFPTAGFTIMSKDSKTVSPVLGAGELYLSGPQVARGYHNNPGLTQERFVTIEQKRFYKTGDLVRMLANGNFEFIGRTDDQVKIRGLRVELDEISVVLQKAHSNIRAVTTQIFKASASAKDQLCAFIKVAPGSDENKPKIQEEAEKRAKENLPAYMVPTFFILVDEIPLSPAGKVDKKTLKEIFQQFQASRGNSIASENNDWSPPEAEIRQAISTLSGVEVSSIKKSTTIYQLGLDSISAVQLAAMLRKKGLNVTAADVLSRPTCAELAQVLERPQEEKPSNRPSFDFRSFDAKYRSPICSEFQINENEIVAVRPCTSLQSGLIANFLRSEGRMYFNYVQLTVPSNIGVENLRGAWKEVVTRHDLLRTGFASVNDQSASFAMITYSPSSYDLPIDIKDGLQWKQDDIARWQSALANTVSSELHRKTWGVAILSSRGNITMHLGMLHSIYDAQSLQVILSDLAAAAKGTLRMPLTPIEPVLQSILQSSKPDEEAKAFWKNFEGKAPTRFPNMCPLLEKSNAFQVCSRTSSSTLSRLESAARKANITLQAAGQAAWARILSSYTGEASVCFGVVLSGRTFENAERAVFPCITTVPVMCYNHESNEALLSSVMDYNARVQKYQFTPLTDIQRLSGHPDDPLFDTLFAYQKFAGGAAVPAPFKLVNEEASADYMISIEMEPDHDDKLLYRITHATNVLPIEQAELLLAQLDAVLIDIVEHPSGHVDDLVERAPPIHSVTPPKYSELPSHVTLLHEFVEFSAKKHPTKIALEFATQLHPHRESRSWTYSEFNAEGNRIANLLVSKGVNPGNLVAICFEKCAQASFAILGILKAGCAYVALDPGAPIARKKYILEDSEAKILLSMEGLSSDIRKDSELPIINLDEGAPIDMPTTIPVLSRQISPQDRSYCLYTSGTTGTPKGCELTHENAVQAMHSFSRLFTPHWDDDSRWLQFASFHFDVSVLEQFWSWNVGIRVVSAPRDLIFEDIAGAIRELGVTHIDLTPSLARLLHPEDVPSLCRGVFITGGEQLRQDILDVWGPKSVIYNGYGPTEATIGVTMYPRVPANGRPSNIGPQFDNVGSFVLRPGSDIPVLRGGVGELCVSGKLVGKGYLKRPDLTAERFPTLKAYGERIYRTGDLVRILHNGCFDFLGRIDDQVKLRGQRLEIGEINAVIKQSAEEIFDVATLVLKHPTQQSDQLVSFIVTQASAKRKHRPGLCLDDLDIIRKVKDACQSKLAGYMVPTHFIPLTAIPLNANNKADARQLKELYTNLSSERLKEISGSGHDSGILSATEEKIRDVLQQMAQVNGDSIQSGSSIFELGLDSISIINFSKALRKVGFVNAQPSVVMRNPTLVALGKALRQATNGFVNTDSSVMAAKQYVRAIQHRYRGFAARVLQVKPADIEDLQPCTPLQEGMISRTLESSKPLYFGSFNYKLSKGTDLSKIYQAWTKVYNSVPVLRAKFVSSADGYVQAVTKSQLPWKDVSVRSEEQVPETLRKYKEECWKSNIEHFLNPIEIVTVQSPSATYMNIIIFHALYDGNSFPTIMERLSSCYHGQETDFGPSFYEVLPYGPLRRVEGAKAFWVDHLTNVTPTRMPPLTTQIADEDTFISVSMSNLGSYENIRRKLDVTDQAIVQACWAATLQKHFSASVTLGLIVSGRSIDHDDADKVIGPLFNTIPFNIKFEKDDSWTSVIRRCHTFNTQALTYQHTPLRDILKWTRQSRTAPLFEALFVFQKGVEERSDDLWELTEDNSFADYPLALEVLQKSTGDLQLTIAAQGAIADQSAANKLLECFVEALTAALKNPDGPITDIVGPIQDSQARKSAQQSLPNGKPTAVQTSSFNWPDEAKIIREEVAVLSGVPLTDLSENSSILEVGLDSIDAIKLSSRLRNRGLQIPVSAIMQCLTILKMAQYVGSAKSSKKQVGSKSFFEAEQSRLADYCKKKIVSFHRYERILPATPLQEAMVAEMVSSEYTRYFNHDIVKIGSWVDVNQLRSAWAFVVEVSPILRTTFVEIDDPEIRSAYAQAVQRFEDISWEELDVRDEKEVLDIPEMIRKRAVQAGNEATLFRLTLASTKQDQYLVISLAHALYDGWSLGLLHQDVKDAYNGHQNSRDDYQDVLQEILDQPQSGAEEFWADFLSGVQGTSFPRRPMQDSTTQRVVHRLETTSVVSEGDIRNFAKAQNISLQALGQTCWSLVLASYTRKLDVAFGVVLSGRDSEIANNVLFPTMNTIAFRSILHGTRKELLHYTQESITSIRNHSHFPLRKVQALASGLGKPLFDTLFLYQRRPDDDSAKAKPLYESIMGVSDVEYPVSVEMEVTDGALIWRCACSEEVLDEEGTKELLERLDRVLKDVMEQPDAQALRLTDAGIKICDLPIFQEATNGYEESGATTANGHLTPSDEWTPMELTIRSVLSKVSAVLESDISKDITMFHLGLDSISAIKVSSLLRKQSINISVSEMLKAGTVARMAQSVVQQQATTELSNQDPKVIIKDAFKGINMDDLLRQEEIDPRNVQEITPATSGQIYLLSVWRNSGGILFYPEFKYRFKSDANAKDLQHAWARTVEENSILRTIFLGTGSAAIPVIQVVLKETAQNNKHEPMVQFRAERSGSEWLLTLKIHHALYDAVSLPVLIQRFEQLLDLTKALEPNAGPFRKFVASPLTNSAVQSRKVFWTKYLANATGAQLPQPSSPKGPRIEIFKPGVLSSISSLKQASKQHGLSIQSFLLAAYARVYARIASKSAKSAPPNEVTIGLYLANRSLAIDGLADVAAPTVSMVPLKVKVPKEKTRETLLQSAQQIQSDLQDIGMLENSTVGLWEIDRWTGVKIDTFVNFLRLPESEDDDAPERDTRNIEEANESAFVERSIVHETEGERDVQEIGEFKTLIGESYLHSLDLELAVRHGNLDIGVFGLQEMMPLEDAEAMVDRFVEELGVLRSNCSSLFW